MPVYSSEVGDIFNQWREAFEAEQKLTAEVAAKHKRLIDQTSFLRDMEGLIEAHERSMKLYQAMQAFRIDT